MPHITAENAVFLAQLSVQARRAKLERAKQAEALALTLAQQVAEQTVAKPALRDKAAILELQIGKVDELLAEATDAKEIGVLAMAKERFINTWGYITGHEKPPTAKTRRQRQPIQDIQPIPAMIEPVPVVPSKPLGWEYD
jgi:hypothetical protein